MASALVGGVDHVGAEGGHTPTSDSACRGRVVQWSLGRRPCTVTCCRPSHAALQARFWVSTVVLRAAYIGRAGIQLLNRFGAGSHLSSRLRVGCEFTGAALCRPVPHLLDALLDR